MAGSCAPNTSCCAPRSLKPGSNCEPLETRIVMDASAVIFDIDGDQIDLKLKGAGRFQVTQVDADGDLFGALSRLHLRDTTQKTTFTIKVTKSATGDGKVDLGSLDLASPLGGFFAPAVNLTGSGIAAGDSVGAITLHGISNGADVTVGGTEKSQLVFTVGSVGDDSNISTPGALQGKFGSVEITTFTAANFGKISATGNFAADVVSTAAAGALAKLPALLSLTVTGGDWSGSIAANGAIGSVTVKSAKGVGGAVTGVNISGSALGSITASKGMDANVLTSGAIVNVTAGGEIRGDWSANRFGVVTATGGNISATINATGTPAQLGKTPSVASITISGGDFTGDLFAHGQVGNIMITSGKTGGGSIVGSTLTAAGFGNVTIKKNLTGSLLLAGADLGADHIPGGTGTNADTFAPGKIASIAIGGNVFGTVVGAGLSPADSDFKNGNDQVLGTPSTALIKSFNVKGTLGNDSLVGAFLLPATVKIGTSKVRPVVDSRFLTNGSVGSNFLTFKLVNDTGLYSTDAVSTDVTVAGHLSITEGLVGFRAAIGAGALQNITVGPDANGDFFLPASLLDTLNGSTLTDGLHPLRVEVRDKSGGIHEFSFTFRKDTTAPTLSADLSAASDTGILGDGITGASVVNFAGTTEAGARVTVGGKSALADNLGKFVLANIALTDGANSLAFQVSDLAGNMATLNATVTKAEPDGGTDVVLEWNALNLEAVRLDASAPPVASRGLAMTSIAMFDVVSAFDGTAGYYTKFAAPSGASIEAAVATAAHRVLSYLYPGQKTQIDAALSTTLSRVPDGAAEDDGATFGRQVADIIIAIRVNDGFDKFVNYTPGNLPGDWQPTGPGFDVALLPQWATLTPFALNTASQFRPDGPPALDSAAYATAFDEVKSLGAATGSTRTADQTQIARFWADGAGTITPPGHWNQIADAAAIEAGNSTAANARMLATLNVALADSAISAWDAKYFYESWRPITAIHGAENDGNAATIEDDAWQSLLITPPFPEYISGHATFSAAAAGVLGNLFGGSFSFSTTSPGLPGVTRSFTSFDAAAQEAAVSRVYGGIHFSFADNDGIVTGDKIGDWVIARFNSRADTTAPVLMLDGLQEGDVFSASPVISGHILDSLSGVASASAKFDGAAPIPLTLDATGKFTLPAAALAHGSHTLVLSATDAVGNVATPRTVHFTVDALDPTLSLATPGSGNILAAGSRLTGQADGTGSPIVSLCYQFDGGQLFPILYDTATGAFDIQPYLGALAPGAHVLTLDMLDAAGNRSVQDVNVTLDTRIAFTVTEHTPASFASEVGSTFRPQVFFSRAVDPASLNAANFYATDTTGAVIPSTIVPAQDGSFAWLFFTNPMLGASNVTVHVLGDTILAAADQQPLDGDEDGTAGGTLTYSFSTVSLTPLAGTSLSGKVVDPGVDLKPMTFDDFRAGPDGIPHTADDVFLNPIAGVKVFVVGLESTVFAFTDAQGNFTLPSVPGGNVKLAVEGRTATNAPAGTYFPEMVMDLQIVPGTANTVMDSMGQTADKIANAGRTEVYLPRLQTSILQEVSATENTMIRVDANAAPNLTDTQRQFLELEVKPGMALGPDGQTIPNPKIGISVVPPELVKDMAPPGLEHSFDFTIQAPGVATFAEPQTITFPNLFNAAPGSKMSFFSYDHTSGRLVFEGTATVSSDGQSVTTDPGVGVTKPGWHITQPGMPFTSQPGGGCDNGQCCTTSGGGNGNPDPFGLTVAAGAARAELETWDDCVLRVGRAFWKCYWESFKNGFKFDSKYAFQTTRKVCYRVYEIQKLECEILPDCPDFPHPSISQLASAPMDFLDSVGERLGALAAEAIDISYPYMVSNRALPIDVSTRIASIETQMETLAQGDPVEYMDRLLVNATLQISKGPDHQGNAPVNPLNYVALIETENGGTSIVRGQTESYGAFSVFAPSGGTVSMVALYDPVTNSIGFLSPDLTPNAAFAFPRVNLISLDDHFLDFDGDGLADIAETVLGTSVTDADTDHDGISDFAEARGGSSPVGGRSTNTGIVSSTKIIGEAQAVVLGDLDGSVHNVFVASGSGGLTIMTAGVGSAPTVLGNVSLAGNSVDVAVDSNLSIAAVASGAGGLHFVDVSIPRAPVETASKPIRASPLFLMF